MENLNFLNPNETSKQHEAYDTLTHCIISDFPYHQTKKLLEESGITVSQAQFLAFSIIITEHMRADTPLKISHTHPIVHDFEETD
jgi:hypothetical protein